MATSIYKFTPKHGVAESSDLKATLAGHIFNMRAAEDIDNGSFAALGDFEGTTATSYGADVWAAKKPAKADKVFLILSSPLIYEEGTAQCQDEANFYNARGDVMRAYELVPYDKFALSAEAFAANSEPGVGKYLVINGAYKAGVAASAPEGQTFVAKIYDIAGNGNFRIIVEKNA